MISDHYRGGSEAEGEFGPKSLVIIIAKKAIVKKLSSKSYRLQKK